MKKFIEWLISVHGLSWTTIIVVIAQSFHYYHFFQSFELFNGIGNYIYSIFLTVVLSLPLLIFTAKLGSVSLKFGNTSSIEREEIKDKYREGVNLYTYVDIVVNIYTWYTKLNVFFGFEWKYFPKYLVATLIAIILPLTLKKFAGELKLKA